MVKIGLLVVITIMLLSFFKQENTIWALVLKIALCIFLGTYVLEQLTLFVKQGSMIGQYLKDYMVYIKVFLKAFGISYICEFVANLAKEEGYLNLGSQVELAGKLSVFSMGIPVLITLFEYIEGFFG